MEAFDYLIVGGGLSAASAVEGIREEDDSGDILLLCDEEEPPYHRPPLSKEYLQVPDATRDLLGVKPEGWYEEAGVDLRLETRVTGLNARDRTVTTADGHRLRGERILVATGGTPRPLEVDGAGLDRVFTLRTVEDAEAIRDAAREAERAVLVGAGFIGMELAATLSEYDVASTVVELADRVWRRMFPPELSGFIRGYYEDRGVEFRMESSVAEFRGDAGVEAAILDDGAEVPCQMAVVGLGIEPNDDLAREAGLAVQDGIVVDEHGETTHGYIYASGDVARFPDPVFGDHVRVEHWDHARAHGGLVGRNMAGSEEVYDHLSYFFSEAFDLSLNVFGRPGQADRVLQRGDFGADGAVAFCGADGRLCGAVLVNANEAMEQCRELVRRRPPLEEVEPLADPAVDLAETTG